jgi:hypothetical protein
MNASCELPRRKTDGASQFIGNSFQNFVVLKSLRFPPRAGVLVPKTQIFLLQHIPISLVFACGIDGQDISYLTRKFWGFVIHPVFVFASAKTNTGCMTNPRSQSPPYEYIEGGDFRNTLTKVKYNYVFLGY